MQHLIDLRYLFPFFLCLLFASCRDVDFESPEGFAQVVISGRVISDYGDFGIEGVTVKAGDKYAITDRNGVFSFPLMQVKKNHAVLHFNNDNFFELSKAYYVPDNSQLSVTVQLMHKSSPYLVNTSIGGSAKLPSGVQVNFPAQAFVDADGNPYGGLAYVYARYLSPEDPSLHLFAPGDMTAINAAEQTVFLATFGMIAVELRSSSGQKLQVAPGKTAEIRMPIAQSQRSIAPANIPLWHYDLETGYWLEEGSAERDGDYYVGQVSHFSFWNCDAPMPLVEIQGRIVLKGSNAPLAFANIVCTVVSNGATSWSYTDNDGRFGGLVPMNEVLNIKFLSYSCDSTGVDFTIGPFSSAQTLPTFIAEISENHKLVTIEGHLKDCEGNNISDGYFIFSPSTQHLPGAYFGSCNSDGSFSFQFKNCQELTEGWLKGCRIGNELNSDSIAISTSNTKISLGKMPLCN